MSDSALRFIIFGDMIGGYWWRLRSAEGQTVEFSERRYTRKFKCEQEVQRLKDARYPCAKVRDATIG